MIVPEFWAEARIQKRFPHRQITVKRFGWSDVSQAEAQRHADQRVQEAFERVVRGEKLPRRERKVRYNGADGLPIREQVVERYLDCVVTRNSYGARCLNTPDVFIADLDYPRAPESCLVALCSFAIGIVVAILVLSGTGNVSYALVSLVLSAIALPLALGGWHKIRSLLMGGRERILVCRIESFADRHREWFLRVYKTPNGFRLIALHKLFDPRSGEVELAFKELEVDRTYALMCQKQNCFRARLTAKPWRIGIESSRKPRAGVWPIPVDQMDEYNRRIAEYESSASNYSACHYTREFGTLRNSNSKAKAVCDFHDRACDVSASNPIA